MFGKPRLAMLTLFILCASVWMPAHAQPYPNRPIKIVLGFGAGGTADAIARFYAQKLHGALNNPVITENKPGAGQVIAIKTLMSAPPDGYTLLVAASPHWLLPLLQPRQRSRRWRSTKPQSKHRQTASNLTVRLCSRLLPNARQTPKFAQQP